MKVNDRYSILHMAALLAIAALIPFHSGCAGTQTIDSPSASGMVEKDKKFDINLGIGDIKLGGTYSNVIHNIIAELDPKSQELWIKYSKVIEAYQVGAINPEASSRCIQFISGVAELKIATEKIVNNPTVPDSEKISALNKYKDALEKSQKEFNSAFQTDVTPKKLLYDFSFSKGSWETWTEGGARASFQFYKSKVLASISDSTGAHHHVQLFQYRLNLTENRRYVLKILVSSNKAGELISMFHKPSPNWVSYQVPDESYFQLNPGLNTVETSFLANKSSATSRLTFYLGQLDSGTEIIIHRCQLYEILE